MFKKKANIKPLAPLRSSDRRKIADQIISDLGIEHPAPKDDATPQEKTAATLELSSLRNRLLPDNCLSARFMTTSGPDLKQVSGTVYAGSHESEEQRILWVKIDDRMYPTVYTLWHNPRMVPLLHTHDPVVAKLQGGADLMTPGLANGPPFPEKASKGSIVAIASTESPSVPLVVGVCEVDVSSLQQIQGAKGQAVRTVTWSGDELWAWSASGKPGRSPPTHIDGWVESDPGIVEVTRQTGSLNISSENSTQEAENVAQREQHDDDEAEQKQWTIKDIDEAFKNAFLYGIHEAKESGQPPLYGLAFPLKPSFIMSSLVQPYLPAFTKSDNEALQIKKTSWKNMKKFIKSLDKELILKSKDRDNEAIVMDVDFEDSQITSFRPYTLPKKESASSGGRGKTIEQADGSDPSIGQRLKVVTLYKAKEKLSPLFGTSDVRGFHTAAELRSIVTSYIETEKLISATNNKRLITLNPFLSNDLIDGHHPNDKEYLKRGTIFRDDLIDRVQFSCSPYHVILRNTSAPDANVKPKAGHAPRIQITLEIRSGSKTVTKVSGLEAFSIPPEPLAAELRKTCAGSTSVEKLMGSSPKNPVMEVMIQGPQCDAVIAALEKRGVDKRWVDVIDKTKKKKK